MADLHERLIVVRPAAEVTLKSKRTRERFMKALRSGVQDALQRNGLSARVRRRPSRLFAYIEDGPIELAEEALGRVFGVGSFSPVRATCAADPALIAEAGHAAFAHLIRGRSFAVRAKRLGQHPFSSMDIARELGAALVPYGRVDLTEPEFEVRVEVLNDRAYLFEERLPGIGGLPAGTEARALALLSGGYDSAVASWRVLGRGVELDFVLFNLGGAAYERMVAQVAKVLSDRWFFGARPSLHVVDFSAVLDDLRANTREDYWQVLLKRLMYLGAGRLAERLGCDALVTGESIGQVSSQTLTNLRVIEAGSPLPILRPLIGTDKRDIMTAAELVGTAALSARIREYCAIASGRPVVVAAAAVAAAEESRLDATLLERAVDEARELKLRALEPADLMLPYLFVEEIPPGAVVLDCQGERLHRAWHYPGSLRCDPALLMRSPPVAGDLSLDKALSYVLYCAHGMQSAHAAEVLQQLGYEAYSFRGGTAALRRSIEGASAAATINI
jgi:thiamine biosynthesis protein ThiI